VRKRVVWGAIVVAPLGALVAACSALLSFEDKEIPPAGVDADDTGGAADATIDAPRAYDAAADARDAGAAVSEAASDARADTGADPNCKNPCVLDAGGGKTTPAAFGSYCGDRTSSPRPGNGFLGCNAGPNVFVTCHGDGGHSMRECTGGKGCIHRED